MRAGPNAAPAARKEPKPGPRLPAVPLCAAWAAAAAAEELEESGNAGLVDKRLHFLNIDDGYVGAKRLISTVRVIRRAAVASRTGLLGRSRNFSAKTGSVVAVTSLARGI